MIYLMVYGNPAWRWPTILLLRADIYRTDMLLRRRPTWFGRSCPEGGRHTNARCQMAFLRSFAKSEGRCDLGDGYTDMVTRNHPTGSSITTASIYRNHRN